MKNKFKSLLCSIIFLHLNVLADSHLSIIGMDSNKPIEVDLAFNKTQNMRFKINSKFWKYCTSQYNKSDSEQGLFVQCYTDEQKGKKATWVSTGCSVSKDRPTQSALMILHPDGAMVHLSCTYKTN